jgi:hypothetical protein
MITRFSHQVLAGVLCAAFLGGCSGGSQLTPPSAGAQQAGFQQAATMHVADADRKAGVSPGEELPPNAWIVGPYEICYYYISRTTGLWTLMYCVSTGGVWPYATAGQLLNVKSTSEAELGNGNINVYKGTKLTNTLTGLSSGSTGLAMDAKGDTFATTAGSATVTEFAKGSSTPTGSFTDANVSSASYLAIDKANHLYVEGPSVKGGIEVDEMFGNSFKPLAQPGTLGATSGGLAVQTSGKGTYVWINDQGNASDSANIARYALKGATLAKQGSFDYSGINGAISVDPTGKDTTDVYAVNNVAAGSGYSVTGIDYAFPTGAIRGQSSAQATSQVATGIWTR